MRIVFFNKGPKKKSASFRRSNLQLSVVIQGTISGSWHLCL